MTALANPRPDHPLRRPRGGRPCVVRLRARHADRDRRPQRRRQDDLLQPDLGAAARRAKAACCWTATTSPALPAPLRTRAGLGRAFQLTQLFPKPHGAGERAPGGAGARAGRAAATATRPAGACGSTAEAWIDEARAILDARARWPTSATCTPAQPAARRPAQARGGAADGARPAGLHVRRADRRHERRRGAGGARPDPRAEGAHATGLILLVEHKMDVVRELADRIIVLHNGAAGGRRRAGDGDRIAGRAAGLPRHGGGRRPA